jgi:hypothetical protein
MGWWIKKTAKKTEQHTESPGKIRVLQENQSVKAKR